MPPRRRLKCHRHANATFHNLVFSSTSRVSIRQTVANSFLFKLLFQINSFFCYLLRTICRFVWISCDSQLSIFFLYYFVSPFIIITSFLLHWAWQLWSQQLLGWQFLFLLFWNNLCFFIHHSSFIVEKDQEFSNVFFLMVCLCFLVFPLATWFAGALVVGQWLLHSCVLRCHSNYLQSWQTTVFVRPANQRSQSWWSNRAQELVVADFEVVRKKAWLGYSSMLTNHQTINSSFPHLSIHTCI